MNAPLPFTLSVPEDCLCDLRRRVDNARWFERQSADGRDYGLDAATVRKLAHRWAHEFDWREVERRINQFSQYTVTIEGQLVHFLRIRSAEPDATPLVLTHGWPWTFWDFQRIFAPLTDPRNHGGDSADAFELIVPSLPGFGFSTPLQSVADNFWKTARLWHRLMTEALGFDRYGAAGGDWGGFVSAELGHIDPEQLIAVHLTQAVQLDTFNDVAPWRALSVGRDGASRERLAFERRYASHLAVHMIEPDTLAIGLRDSPVGLLAWLLQRLLGWSDAYIRSQGAPDPEHLLTNATLYWASDCLPDCLRFYANAAIEPWQASHNRTPRIGAPTGISLFAGDLPHDLELDRLTETFPSSRRGRDFNLVHFAVHEQGGHFAHRENPDAIVQDIRATFRAARKARASGA